ncbi:hypothetical protein V5R04_15535 [Jonesiaceae bacterium BS-20]|uniref:Uncharacterized protein n=1 Tax=Jonesiaceae bacterium BS-20 TaxID=3120821 RepID=A0AAU7DWD7_9MICO
MTIDYTNTKKAKTNRTKKANTLALAAAALGLLSYELLIPGSTLADEQRRERVRKHAGFKARPSDATWEEATMVLMANSMALPETVLCGVCSHPVRRVRTGGGSMVDLDVYAHPAGNVWPHQVGGKVVAEFITGTDSAPDDAPLFRLHSKSCPLAKDAWKRRLAEAPKCRACGEPLSGRLAYTWREYHTHPNCYEEEVISDGPRRSRTRPPRKRSASSAVQRRR